MYYIYGINVYYINYGQYRFTAYWKCYSLLIIKAINFQTDGRCLSH